MPYLGNWMLPPQHSSSVINTYIPSQHTSPLFYTVHKQLVQNMQKFLTTLIGGTRRITTQLVQHPPCPYHLHRHITTTSLNQLRQSPYHHLHSRQLPPTHLFQSFLQISNSSKSAADEAPPSNSKSEELLTKQPVDSFSQDLEELMEKLKKIHMEGCKLTATPID
ncbi:hypothetical protein LINGRAHAP2_LOCUS9651 [Linum grandiflorum]